MSKLAQQLINKCLETQSTYLDLGNCGITDLSELPELFTCTHLETLVLSNEWLEWKAGKLVSGKRRKNFDPSNRNRLSSVPQDLGKLTSLTKLVCGGIYDDGWAISDISFLRGLTGLQTLVLHFNQIQDISLLKVLKSLKYLDLGGNQIQDISVLKDLKQLQNLYLYNNQIENISSLLGLKNLKALDLTSNHKSQDLSFLQGLKNLHSLKLGWNQIQDISVLLGLKNLKELELNSNQISNISSLLGLTSLQTLDLTYNQIQDISCLQGLKGLQSLHLSDNQIQDISELRGLTALQVLDLMDNRIESISLAFLNSLPSFYLLTINRNHIQGIPKEICDKNGGVLEGVRLFLEDLEKEATQNNEVKVLLIGNGNVGKTQLAKRLAGEKQFQFNPNHNSTHAISLLRRHLPSDLIPAGLQLNLWDFGGQDLYHGTHRLFMQTRALFLLVWDQKNETSDYHEWEGKQYKNEKLRYWLEYTTYYGKNSPILVIQNKVDEEAQKAEGLPRLEQEDLKAGFPNIVDFWQLSAKTGYQFAQLEFFIEEAFLKNETLRQDLTERLLPTSWVKVRDRVRREQAQEDGSRQISVDTFWGWCEEAGVAKSVSIILSFFHDTGVLYYQEGYFSGNIILDQAWVIEKIYKLLDRKGDYASIIQQKLGELNYRLIRRIWSEDTDQERELYIDFLLSAELCFETTENKQWDTPLSARTFKVPQLLPEEKPEDVDISQQLHGINQVQELTFRFLPPVFIQQFMVRSHNLVETSIRNKWLSGIYLRNGEQHAVVEAQYHPEPKIIIRSCPGSEDLVRAVREELDAINQNISVKAEVGEISEGEKIRGLRRLNSKSISKPINSSTMKKQFTIFVSYSSKDRDLRELLVEGLREQLHHRSGVEYNIWADDAIDLGANWKDDIEEALEKSDGALLLVSASFASSEFINRDELPEFFKKKKEAGFLMMPILVREYDFHHFKNLSTLNFFKTYYPEYEFDDLSLRNKLIAFSIVKKTNDYDLVLRYCKKLAQFIHTSVTNHFAKTVLNNQGNNIEQPTDEGLSDSKSPPKEISDTKPTKSSYYALIEKDIDESFDVLAEVFPDDPHLRDINNAFGYRRDDSELPLFRSKLKAFVRQNMALFNAIKIDQENPESQENLEEPMFKILANLDFKPQEGKFSGLIRKRKFSTFIVRGNGEYGQSWLIHQLLKRNLPTSECLVIGKLPNHAVIDLDHIVKTLCRKFPSDFEEDDKIDYKLERIAEKLPGGITRDIVIVINDVSGFLWTESFYIFYESFINHITPRARNIDYNIILLLKDTETKLYTDINHGINCWLYDSDQSGEPEFLSIWQDNQAVPYIVCLHEIPQITCKMLREWKETITENHILQKFQTEECIRSFIRECDNGNPHQVILQISNALNYSSTWLKY
ncbi:MAG: leucine-rich repeat domain-containing protein [Cyclobacteriaceae bacterium]